MTDLATLGVRIESQDAVTAHQRLDKLSDSAKKTEQAADGISGASKRAGGAIANMAEETKRLLREQDRLNEMQARAAGLHIGNQQALTKSAGATRLAAHETANLAAQIQDIGVSLASGQSPFLVLTQQGSQIGQVFKGSGLSVGAFAGAAARTAASMLPMVGIIAAVGFGVDFLTKKLTEGAERAHKLADDIAKMNKALGQSVPMLMENANSAGLAAEGAKNFEAWIAKNSELMGTYAERLKTATVNQYLFAAAQAGAQATELQTQHGKFFTKDNLLQTFGEAVAGPEAVEGFRADRQRKYESTLNLALENQRVAQARATAAANAPTSAFVPKPSKTAKGPETPRDMTDERTSQIAQLMAGAQGDLLRAQLGVTRELDARTAIERQIAASALAEKQAQIDRQIAGIQDDKGLSAASKESLTAQLQIVGFQERRVNALQVQAINDTATEASARQTLSIQQAQIDAQIDALGYARDQSRTAAGRRDVELRLLALAEKRERIGLQAVGAPTSLADPNEKAVAEIKLKALADSHGGKVQSVLDGTAGPAMGYLKQLDLTGDKMIEEMERVKVRGLQGLEDGLVGVIGRTKSLGSAFHDVANGVIADLARIAIRQQIIQPLFGALFPGVHLPPIPGYADGTSFAPGGLALVGERGPELVNLPRGAQVIPNEAAKAPKDPGAGAGGVHIEMHVNIDAKGAGPREIDVLRNEVAGALKTLPGQTAQKVIEKLANRLR